jgi:hypothetical protein
VKSLPNLIVTVLEFSPETIVIEPEVTLQVKTELDLLLKYV